MKVFGGTIVLCETPYQVQVTAIEKQLIHEKASRDRYKNGGKCINSKQCCFSSPCGIIQGAAFRLEIFAFG